MHSSWRRILHSLSGRRHPSQPHQSWPGRISFFLVIKTLGLSSLSSCNCHYLYVKIVVWHGGFFWFGTCISSGLSVSPRFDMTQASSDRFMNPLPSWQHFSQSAQPPHKIFPLENNFYGEVYSPHQRPGRLPWFRPLHSQPRPKCCPKYKVK